MLRTMRPAARSVAPCRRGIRTALALALASLPPAPLPAGEAPQGDRAARKAEPTSPRAEAARLAEALALKEGRRLDEALRILEELSARSGAGAPGLPGLDSRGREGGGGPAPGETGPAVASAREGRQPTAAGLLAECEILDARLRQGRLEGLEARIGRLRAAWDGLEDLRRRGRALEGLLAVLPGSLLEPNAIASERVDVGAEVLRRCFPGVPPKDIRIPLDIPIRHLANLSPAPTKGLRDLKAHGLMVVVFLEAADFDGDRGAPFRAGLRKVIRDPRVLIAAFVFTGDGELPPERPADPLWGDAVVFWIRGTPETLVAAPVRTRYEWIPGPTAFLVERGARILGWRWPWEGWAGFGLDLDKALAGLPPLPPAPSPGKR